MSGSDLFRQLADKIDKNAPEDFGGAFIVVPPSGDPISGMMIGEQDVNTFWILVKTKLEAEVEKLNQLQKQQQNRMR